MSLLDRLTTRKRGDRAENLAQKYLAQQGLKLLHQNYRSHHGEIDIIMQDRDTVVFVEVRYRASADFGHAGETVNQRKQARIIKTAQTFLQRHKAWLANPARFDVIVVTGTLEAPAIEWFDNAFPQF